MYIERRNETSHGTENISVCYATCEHHIQRKATFVVVLSVDAAVTDRRERGHRPRQSYEVFADEGIIGVVQKVSVLIRQLPRRDVQLIGKSRHKGPDTGVDVRK